MSAPGQAVTGIDAQDHLWIVLSRLTTSGTIALANLTTHRPRQKTHRGPCVLIERGEHPFVKHLSCVAYHRAAMKPGLPFDSSVRRGRLVEHPPLSPDLLYRIQIGALAAPRIRARVVEAVQATLDEV